MGPTDFESKTRGLDPYAYLHGKAFLDASKTIIGTYHLAHVRAAMQAFAIEVLLKSMQSERQVRQVYMHGEEPGSYILNDDQSSITTDYPNGGHNVLNVYKNLDDDLRAALRYSYSEANDQNLDDVLAEIGNLFMGLRYLYEEQSFSYSGMLVETVADFLVEFIDQYQKTPILQKESWAKEI